MWEGGLTGPSGEGRYDSGRQDEVVDDGVGLYWGVEVRAQTGGKHLPPGNRVCGV